MEKRNNDNKGVRKIINPYKKNEGYNCFGCSPDNIWGLRMSFYEEGDYITSRWLPHDNFQGYHNVLHGGIQAALMDEIASWVVHIKLKTAGVTARLETKYIKPVLMNRGAILLKAKIIDDNKRIAKIKVELFDSQNILCSESTASYFIYPESFAKENLQYPDYREFFFNFYP